jgi:hypothetical protein
MFIVKKTSMDCGFLDDSFEVLRVSNNESVIQYCIERGFYKIPSKVGI